MIQPSSVRWRRARRQAFRRVAGPLFRLLWRVPDLRRIGLQALVGGAHVEGFLAPGVLVLVPFGDHKLLVDPADDKIGFTLLHGRAWNREHVERALARMVAVGAFRAGGVFVDVGANIGAVTVYAMRTGRFVRAIAIEPDPHNFAILTQNIALNGLADRVSLIQAAAGTAGGSVLLKRDARNLGAHTIHDRSLPTPADSVAVTQGRLDDLLRQAGVVPAEIGLLKIDVEGHELAVLDGAPLTIAATPPILMEYLSSAHGPAGTARLRHVLARYDEALIIDSDRTGEVGLRLAIAALDAGEHEADIAVYRRTDQ